MRLLNLVHQYLPERVGGTELYTQAIGHAMASRGHEVAIFCRSDSTSTGVRVRSDAGQVRVWAASTGALSPTARFLASYRNPGLQAAFEHVLDTFRPDLVHVQHMMGLPAAFGRIMQRRHIPYVITLWDFWWRCANAQLLTNYSAQICPGPSATFLNCAHCALARAGHPGLLPGLPLIAPLMAARNAALQSVIDGSSRLIAPTEFVRQWYLQHGFPAEKTLVLPPALDYPEPSPRTAGERGLRAAYIGGLSSQKGVHNLIEAFGGLRGAAELWIAGDETADPDYSRQLHKIAGANIRFLGRLGRAEVWEMLAQVDVLAVPTLWYETYSFVISEAFVAGLPVLASRLGPIADRVRDGVDGRLLPPGDVAAWRNALQKLLDAPADLDALRTGVRPPEPLSRHAEQLEALFQEALGLTR